MIKTVGTAIVNYNLFQEGIYVGLNELSSDKKERASVYFNKFHDAYFRNLRYDTDDLFLLTEGFTRDNYSFVLGRACAIFYIKKQLEA